VADVAFEGASEIAERMAPDFGWWMHLIERYGFRGFDMATSFRLVEATNFRDLI
jgi:hypothetical protein